MSKLDLDSLDVECDRGIVMSNQTNWSKQVDQAVCKATQKMPWIFRNVTSRSKYKSLVRPHLEYCVQVWAPTDPLQEQETECKL